MLMLMNLDPADHCSLVSVDCSADLQGTLFFLPDVIACKVFVFLRQWPKAEILIPPPTILSIAKSSTKLTNVLL